MEIGTSPTISEGEHNHVAYQLTVATEHHRAMCRSAVLAVVTVVAAASPARAQTSGAVRIDGSSTTSPADSANATTTHFVNLLDKLRGRARRIAGLAEDASFLSTGQIVRHGEGPSPSDKT